MIRAHHSARDSAELSVRALRRSREWREWQTASGKRPVLTHGDDMTKGLSPRPQSSVTGLGPESDDKLCC